MENEAKQQPPTATGPTWDMVKSITGEALELPPAERDAFVRDRCGEDQGLFAQVLELVAASDTQTDVLSHDGIPARVLGEAVGTSPVAQGTEVGRYRLGVSLGSGGMGTVYEAFDAALNRKVAIKFLNVGMTSARARRRFETEARALAKLEHPAIARVFEAGVHTVADQVFSLPYFAMEFVPAARTLDAWAREHTPDLRRLLDLLATVCDAVHHGHQKGVLHRDIKPSNILVSGAGEVKVIDFGLSRLAGESAEAGTTNTGDVAGTPAYMAPEAFVQGMSEVDTRADVYSLGVVAYELLAGCHPRGSAGLTPHRAGVLSRSRPAQPLSRLRPECRGDIETIVLKAMESEPADRYQSAAELGADLRRVLRFEPILARPSPVWRHALLFARRHTGLAAASAVALIAVVVGIAGLQVGLSHARQSEQRAILQAQRADRTSRFVMQMLRSASPFRGEKFEDRFSAARLPGEGDDHWPSAASPGRAPAVGDLIMVAMEQLEASFPDDPALRADMAAALSQTAASISDPRLQSLQKRAAELLQQAYGINDRRTLIARHLLHSTMLLDGAGAALPEIERDLATLRSPATATDRELLCRVATLYLQAMSLSGKSEQALAVLRQIREELAAAVPEGDRSTLTLDLAILRTSATKQNAASSLNRIPDLLDRAARLEQSPGELTLVVLFLKQELQRLAGDSPGALETLRQGAALSTSYYGGMDKSTYEWWSNVYFVCLQLKDFAAAEDAARKQVAGAQAMLGAHSFYTTKAFGRLARSLLSQGIHSAEAEHAARQAVEGAPDLLERGDGWALFHELLWAWVIRLQGDSDRALNIIRRRMEIESAAGRPEAVAWVEVVRYAELAQGEMDRADHAGSWAASLSTIEALVRKAEAYAAMLEPDWPSRQLTADARARFDAAVAGLGPAAKSR